MAAVAAAACLAVLAASDAQVDIRIGGHDRKDTGGHPPKDCQGAFCPRIDAGGVLDKLVTPSPQTTPTKVCVAKFNDVNGNGHKDFSEIGLANWNFTIVGPIGSVPLTTGTGGACFTSQFPAGSYTVTETAQSGWLPTTPGGQSQTFTLVPGNDVTLIFGNRYSPTQIPGVVCITKYNDLNGNGVRDSGEPVLPGWLFTVKNSAGAIVDFGTTNAQGVFCTTHPLSPGSASVVETPQSGWTSTDPGGALPTKAVTVVAGQTVYVAFGNHVPTPKGQICVTKYNDLNANGVYASGEPLLAGWQFTITGPSGPITLTTGANGAACTPINLTLGTYVVTEVSQTGWVSTAPGGTSPQRTVMVLAGASANSQMFGNVHTVPGQICIDKYLDQNRNGQFDSGEPVLSGWTFTVRDSSGAVVATGVTDAQGRFCTAPGIALGTYDVTETQQPWWVSTDPQGPPMASPPWHKTVTVGATHVAEVRFGNIKSGRLCVFKYNDLNGNGQFDPGEPPLSGWTFRTRYTSWVAAAEDSITTDATGTACIDLPPGPNQQIDENQQPGWGSTDPVGIPVGQGHFWTYKVYTIVQGQTTNVSIGNRLGGPLSGSVCIVKYNDVNHNGQFDPGEWKLAGWHFTVKTAAGAVVGTLVTSNGAPACMDLPAGSYIAVETMQYGWHNSDPAGANPQKAFAVGSAQHVNLVFGNFQIPLP
ncbi:MAG TPA: SdrD B-like domain-containing protein [Rhizomicrobium sp.]